MQYIWGFLSRKDKNRLLLELDRRFREVDYYKDRTLDSQESVKSFFARIADYLNYIEINKFLHSSCLTLEKSIENLNINRDLEDQGKTILSRISKDFNILKKEIKKNHLQILTLDQIPNGSLNEQQGISIYYLNIENFIMTKNESISGLIDACKNIYILIQLLNANNIKTSKLAKIYDYYKSHDSLFDTKIRARAVQLNYLRYTDYLDLKQVWNYYYKREDLKDFMALRMRIGDFISDSITYPTLRDRDVHMVEKEKQSYLNNIYRFHNFIIDNVEKESLIEIILNWLWNNFGKTLISLLLIAITWLVFKSIGLNAPLEWILDILKP